MVRQGKSSSADGTRGGGGGGGEHKRGNPLSIGGLPRDNFEFLALLCAFLMGFMRLGPDFSHDFLLENIFLGA